MRILMAFDGSPHALKALDALVARRSWFREAPAIDLIHVHLPVPYGAAAAWVGNDTLRRYYEDESEALLAAGRKRLDATGIAHATIAKVGDPAAEVVRYAKEGGYELLAAGTHGHTALANMVLGSVATKIVALSPLPVLLLR